MASILLHTVLIKDEFESDKMLNILWFQLFRYEDFCLFVSYNNKIIKSSYIKWYVIFWDITFLGVFNISQNKSKENNYKRLDNNKNG